MGGGSEAHFSNIPLLFLYAINKPTFIEKNYPNNQRGLQKKNSTNNYCQLGELGVIANIRLGF